MDRTRARVVQRVPMAAVAVLVIFVLPWNAEPSGATTLTFGSPVTFQETGSVNSTYTTPTNTCDVLIDALGGAGGTGYAGTDEIFTSSSDVSGPGGAGGYLSALVPLNGGQTLSVAVGAGGGNGTYGTAGAGGYGGGGNGGSTGGESTAGGGGGGESVVSSTGNTVLAVAGGGGGADSDWLNNGVGGGAGGAGANTSGSAGANSNGPFGGDYSPGEGGTLSAGCAGSSTVSGTYEPSAGSANQGGNGSFGGAGEVGGGGGSGYFGGGGGGERSGGGGGSTYAISGSGESNVATWTPSPTVSSNGEVVITAEECQSTTFGAAPTSPGFGGQYTPSATSTSGLTDVFSIASATPSNCSISSGVVSFTGLGSCTVLADQAGNASWAPASEVAQTFLIGQGTPSAPSISNLPGSAVVGGNFTPSVTTNGDGNTSVTDNSTSYCTISSGVVTFTAVGTCSLTAHVGTGTNYLAANGTAQTFSIMSSATTFKSYTITFDAAGGTAVPSIAVLAGSAIELPQPPVLTGSTFEGWFSAPTGGTALVSPFVAGAATTLYAQWSTKAIANASVPSAPTIRVTSTSKSSILITLVKPSTSNGEPVTGYVYSIGGAWFSLTFNMHHQATLSHLKSGHDYYVALRATNEIGVGSVSKNLRVKVL